MAIVFRSFAFDRKNGFAAFFQQHVEKIWVHTGDLRK